MNIKSLSAEFSKHKTPCLVAGYFKGSKGLGPFLDGIDKKLNGTITSLIAEKDFTGSFKQVRVVDTHGLLPFERVLLVGLGKKENLTLEVVRKSSALAAKAAKELSVSSFSSLFLQQIPKSKECPPFDIAFAVAEAIGLALYEFKQYQTPSMEDKKGDLKRVSLLLEKKDSLVEKAIKEACHVTDAVHLARDLINHPGNIATPTFLASTAKGISKKYGLKCKILEKAGMEKLGMGALLAVSRGSEEPPKLICMEYSGGKKGDKPVVIVGKGLTFDSGGISLKPGAQMDEMKMDMSGGAAAIGVMQAAAAIKLPVNLVSIIPASENMPDGRANKPGDILKSMSGTTIEVLNTDAEGRLILADALTYAKRFKPKAVIDIATLTGACVIALGHHAAAVLGSDPALVTQLKDAGEHSGERVWELPIWKEYEEQIKSSIADIKNTGGRPAGTITAAAFLKRFTSGLNWAHLDIAGTAWNDKGSEYVPKGGSGVGVRLLIEYLRRV